MLRLSPRSLLTLVLAGCAGIPSALAADIDGDGIDDLVIGAPGARVGSVTGGVVDVLYGDGTGLVATGADHLHQDEVGVDDAAETEDDFGRAVGAGDMDGDGYADLVVGVQGEDIDGVLSVGMAHVLYGSSFGAAGVGSDSFILDDLGVEAAGSTAGFGVAIAVGDFDGDGYDDAAIVADRATVGGLWGVGTVYVLYGSRTGPSAADTLSLAQGTDGRDDLAIAVEYEDVGAVVDAGMVQVVSGGSSGLSGVQSWYQGSSIGGAPGYQDWFGWALAAGDYDGDGHGDLAISVPYESGSGGDVVHVLYGARGGLSATGSQSWDRDDSGVPGANSGFGAWGYALR